MPIELLDDSSNLRDFQTFHEILDREKNFDTDMLRNVAFLTEEIGEVVEAIRRLNRANSQSDKKTAQMDIGEELADCLAYLLKLANYAQIDLHNAYITKMKRNLGRTWR